MIQIISKTDLFKNQVESVKGDIAALRRTLRILEREPELFGEDGDEQKAKIEDLLKIPELAMNPLCKRIITLFRPQSSIEKDAGVWQINFKEFLKALSVFSDHGTDEEKARFAFRIYDIDNDGYISENELFEVMKTMVGDNVDNENLKEIVKTTIEAWDNDGDGKLSFEEFRSTLSQQNTSHMTMKIELDN